MVGAYLCIIGQSMCTRFLNYKKTIKNILGPQQGPFILDREDIAYTFEKVRRDNAEESMLGDL